MLKTVVLLHIFVETVIFLYIESTKGQYLFAFICKLITFDQFNASLLNKIINFLYYTHTHMHKPLNNLLIIIIILIKK